MAIFGTIIPAHNVASVLREENKYKEAQAQLDKLSEQLDTNLATSIQGAKFDTISQLGLLQKGLANDVLGSYMESNRQQSAILGSNLGQGYKAEAVDDLDDALNNAYESYLINYKQNKQSMEGELRDTIAAYEQQAAQGKAQIEAQRNALDESIMDEAAKYEEFYGSITEYLDWLYDEENEGYADYADALSKGDWSKYFTNENGYIGSGALGAKMYDTEGKITDEGKAIVSMIMSDALGQQGVIGYGYQDFLEKTGRDDLGKWLSSASRYSTEDDQFTNLIHAMRYYGIEPDENGLFGYKYIDNVEDIVPTGYGFTEQDYKDMAVAYNNNNQDKPKVEYDSEGNSNYYQTSDFGKVAIYEGGNIKSFNDLDVGVNKIRDVNGDNFTVKYVDDSGKTHRYKLEVSDEDSHGNTSAILDSSTKEYRTIENKVGKITPNKLYQYGNDLFVAVESKSGAIRLRRVQGRANDKDYQEFTKLMNGDLGQRYSIVDVSNGIRVPDGSIDIDKVIQSNKIKKAIIEELKGPTIPKRR